jgi:hypothetical protein
MLQLLPKNPYDRNPDASPAFKRRSSALAYAQEVE